MVKVAAGRVVKVAKGEPEDKQPSQDFYFPLNGWPQLAGKAVAAEAQPVLLVEAQPVLLAEAQPVLLVGVVDLAEVLVDLAEVLVDLAEVLVPLFYCGRNLVRVDLAIEGLPR